MKKPFCLSALSLAISFSAHGEDLASINIISPAKLPQSHYELASAITIITKEQIKNRGITSIIDALKLIPGMTVVNASGWDSKVNYHGTNALYPRRMLLQVDGLSMYRNGLAVIDWEVMPFDIEDIERIEATRGPNSTAYGSNAFNSVINIITKHPEDNQDTSVGVQGGSNGYEKYSFQKSGSVNENLSVLFSASKERSGGFDDVNYDSGYAIPIDKSDDSVIERYRFRLANVFDNGNEFEFRFGGVKGDLDVDNVDGGQQTLAPKLQRDWFVDSIYKFNISPTHTIDIQANYRKSNVEQEWRSAYPTALLTSEMVDLFRANPVFGQQFLDTGMIPPGGTAEENALVLSALTRIIGLGAAALEPFAFTADHDVSETRTGFEVLDTYLASDSFKISTGINYYVDELDSQTFMGRAFTTERGAIFSNASWDITNRFLINMGGIVEKTSNTDSHETSFRLGANYKILPNLSARITYATADRMPSMFETDAYWTYDTRDWEYDLNGDGLSGSIVYWAQSDPSVDLDPESMTSFDVGLYGLFNDIGLEIDFRIFKEDIDNAISENVTVFDFSQSNDSYVELTGFEGEISKTLGYRLKVTAGFSYVDNDTNAFFETTGNSEKTGYASLEYETDYGYFTLSYYGASDLGEEKINEYSINYNKDFQLSSSMILNINSKLIYNENTEYGFLIDETDRVVFEYDEHKQFMLGAKITF